MIQLQTDKNITWLKRSYCESLYIMQKCNLFELYEYDIKIAECTDYNDAITKMISYDIAALQEDNRISEFNLSHL